MAIGDSYRVTMTGTGHGSTYQNVVAVKLKSTTTADAVTFSTFVADFISMFKGGQTTLFTWTEWEAHQLWGSGMTLDTPHCRRLNGRAFTGTITSGAGTSVGDSLPPQAAVVHTLVTGFAGRRKRGRLYTMAQTEANQADGLWSSVYFNGMVSAWNTFGLKYFNDTGTSTELKMGVWSERTASGCVPATPPATGHVQIEAPQPDDAFTDVTSITVRPIVYGQRRRTRGVGR